MTAEILELDRGDRRKVRATFKDATGALADPTVVELHVRPPSPAAVVVYSTALAELAHPSVGIYERAITFDTSGRWTLRGEGTGAVVAATSPTEVQVRDDPFD